MSWPAWSVFLVNSLRHGWTWVYQSGNLLTVRECNDLIKAICCNVLIKAIGWSNCDTFIIFYNKRQVPSDVSQHHILGWTSCSPLGRDLQISHLCSPGIPFTSVLGDSLVHEPASSASHWHLDWSVNPFFKVSTNLASAWLCPFKSFLWVWIHSFSAVLTQLVVSNSYPRVEPCFGILSLPLIKLIHLVKVFNITMQFANLLTESNNITLFGLETWVSG